MPHRDRTRSRHPALITRNAGFFATLRLHSIRAFYTTQSALPKSADKGAIMKVSEILQVKGNILYTATPEMALVDAVNTMAEKDIGSLVVMEFGDLVGMLTFREVIKVLHKNGGSVGAGTVRKHMDDHPITVTPDTEVNEVRRMMLEKHARYLPVMNAKTLLGVISFYDVARAVLEAQSFENRMLKAYIRDWPAEVEQED
jgi:CBS domain-containing protein